MSDQRPSNERDAFEAWCKESGLITDWTKGVFDDELLYQKPLVQLCWQCWQAARATVEPKTALSSDCEERETHGATNARPDGCSDLSKSAESGAYRPANVSAAAPDRGQSASGITHPPCAHTISDAEAASNIDWANGFCTACDQLGVPASVDGSAGGVPTAHNPKDSPATPAEPLSTVSPPGMTLAELQRRAADSPGGATVEVLVEDVQRLLSGSVQPTSALLTDDERTALKQTYKFLLDQEGQSHAGYYGSAGWAGTRLLSLLLRTDPTKSEGRT